MDRSDFRKGVVDASPLLLGAGPFGIVVGIAAANAGLGPIIAVGFSAIVFAGAAQLAALELLSADANLAVVVLTAAVINLRMMMYSASIAPYFRRFSRAWKAITASVLVDYGYVLSIAEFRTDDSVDRKAYYMGVSLLLWSAWVVTTALGYAVGQGVPSGWGLEFTIPLVFLSLLVPNVIDGATLGAAIAGGGVAIVGAGLPLNLGLLVGAMAGIASGLVVETLGEGPDGD